MVKAADSKSAGFIPRRFKSCCCRKVYILLSLLQSFTPPTTMFCSTFLIFLLSIYPIIIHLPFCQQLLRILLTSQYPINTSHNHQHSTQHNTTQTKTHTHEPQLTSRQSTNQHTQRTQHIQHRYPFGATTSNDKQSTHVPQQTIHYCHNYGITLSISHIINTTIQLSYSTPIDTHTHTNPSSQSITTIQSKQITTSVTHSPLTTFNNNIQPCSHLCSFVLALSNVRMDIYITIQKRMNQDTKQTPPITQQNETNTTQSNQSTTQSIHTLEIIHMQPLQHIHTSNYPSCPRHDSYQVLLLSTQTHANTQSCLLDSILGELNPFSPTCH